MTVHWTIRAARPEDTEGLRGCMMAAYAGYQDRMGGERLPPMDVDYGDEIRDFPTWVVDLDGSIVGGLILVFGGDHVSIANVAVDPAFHGKGIGGALLDHAQRVARDRGISELRLATHVLLTENVSLYTHLGWTESGRDEVRVMMRKRI